MITFYILSIIAIVGTLLPISHSKHWFVRGQAYFRFWYFLLNLALSGIWLFQDTISASECIVGFLLFVCALVSLRDILPFTRWYKKEIKDCSNKLNFNKISIMVYNVYQENDEFDKLIDKVHLINSDILLLLETNEKWRDSMAPLKEVYPYNIKCIQENTYGMMLFSKFKPLEQSVDQLSDDDIPSIDCLIKIEEKKVRIRGLHPKPPIPGEAMTSEQKDAEFNEAAIRISQLPKDELKIVIGDLNDVVWSKASKRFKKTSQLKDPRVGRGTYSTFPTYLPIRFPLDHIFCSSDLMLSELRVLENLGSDHFPIFVEFCLEN